MTSMGGLLAYETFNTEIYNTLFITLTMTGENSCTTGTVTVKNTTKFVCLLKCGENGDKRNFILSTNIQL
jgi:hypothetical protein